MRIAIVGGAFDPITKGHVAITKHIAWIMDAVYFMPAKSHADKQMTPGGHRLEMIERALCAAEGNVFASRFELDNDFGQQTYDVMKGMRKLCPDDQLFFVMGQDAADSVLWSWQNGAEFIKENRCIVIPRTGYSSQYKTNEVWYRKSEHTFLEDVMIDPVSSTAVRQLLQKRDKRASDFLHPDVYAYILKHELYL